MSTDEALIAEVARHPGSPLLFVSSFGIRATSLFGDGLGFEGYEVDIEIAPWERVAPFKDGFGG